MVTRSSRTSPARKATWRSFGPAVAVPAFAVGALVLAGCTPPNEQDSDMTVEVTPPVWTGSPEPASDDHGHGGPAHTDALIADLELPNGTQIGTVSFVESDPGVRVTVTVRPGSTLTAGFHGFHIHDVGVCEANSVAPTGGEPGNFLSSGGHWALGGSHTHAEGAGDMPALLVADDGSAYMVFQTDRFGFDDLTEGDGTSVIVHLGPDNYGNIPDRYTLPDNAPVPDAQTLATGDAGGRAACGVVHEEGH